MFALIIPCIIIYTTVASSYNENSAFPALYYSFTTYCDPSVITDWDCPLCDKLPHFTLDTVVNAQKKELLAFTGYSSSTGQVIISFRGSTNCRNIQLDANLYQMCWDDAPDGSDGHWCIHDGFYNGLQELLDSGLYDSIEYLFAHHKRSKVLLTGHSLGGALAEVLALLFHTDDKFSKLSIGSVEIITFGAPRWGSKDLVTYFNTLPYTNWRVVNKYDIVPTLPLKPGGLYGYYQPSTEIEYDFGTLEYTVCDGDGEESSNCGYDHSFDMKYHSTYLGVEDSCEKHLEENEVESEENNKLMVVVGVIIGCLLFFICCSVLGLRMYYNKVHKEEDQEHYLRVNDTL